jgi:RNA polymerase sigma factor (sigma-70 family)
MDDYKIYKALKKLSTKDILIVYLKFVKEYTLHEIADRVMMSHEGVRGRLKKIYEKLGETNEF